MEILVLILEVLLRFEELIINLFNQLINSKILKLLMLLFWNKKFGISVVRGC